MENDYSNKNELISDTDYKDSLYSQDNKNNFTTDQIDDD